MQRKGESQTLQRGYGVPRPPAQGLASVIPEDEEEYVAIVR